MPGFGTPFARPFGAGPSVWQLELAALLDAYAPGWDRSETSQSTAEVHALALGVAIVWAVNRRLEGQRIPARMLETLPRWERACNLRPAPTDTAQARRAAVAARFLGYAGNAPSDIYNVCTKLAGAAFLGLVTVTDSAAITYCPGINPGPPGFEWTSTRATVAVQLQRTGLPDAAYFDLVRKLRNELAILCPAWMTFQVGSAEGGFVPGVGIPGVTLL